MEVLAMASGKAERTDKCFIFSNLYICPLTSGEAQTSVNSYFDTPSLYVEYNYSLYSTFTTTTRMFWSSLSVLILAMCQSPGKKIKNLLGSESTNLVLSTSYV